MAADAILIISQQSEIAPIREALGQRHGWSIVPVQTVVEGLQKAARSSFDFVLYHWGAGHEDMSCAATKSGSHAADDVVRLRRHMPTVPILMLWDQALESIPVRALEADIAAYLRWPDHAERLLAKLNDIRETRQVVERTLEIEMRLANLQSELDRHALAITTLYGVGRALANVVDEAALFEAVADAAQHLAVADEGSVSLRENEGDALVLRAKRTLNATGPSNGQLRIEDSLAEMVLQTGQTLLIADMAARSERSARYLRSLLDVPLQVGDQVVGVISVVNKVTDRSFTRDDSLVLSILADYASVALENARLYQRSKQGAAVDVFRQTVATLSHHVNNPLAAMLAALHMLRSDLMQKSLSPDGRALQTLAAMEAKADEIASVIAVMQEVVVPTSTAYWKSERMIDIEKELRRRLSALTTQP